MTLLQAAAVLILWRSAHFDTLDIARLLSIAEPDVVKVLDEVRRRERGPELFIVESA